MSRGAAVGGVAPGRRDVAGRPGSAATVQSAARMGAARQFPFFTAAQQLEQGCQACTAP